MKGYTGRRSGWKWGLLILAVALILAGVLGFRWWNGQSRTVAMSDQERETYGLYRVTPPDGESAALTSEGLLTHCTPETTEVLDNNGQPLETVTYTSDVLEDWLPDCRALRGISGLDGLLYIVYDTEEGQEVWLTYGAEGLAEQLVYEPDTDTLYQPVMGEKTFHFRQGK
ncbi:hypothetical protein [uncultured Intestinimonas sp.]|uniref:hypothetical protein n=1 Tax=uncultured Intestinimonas sp. TaxID=1689265 RepID=UPI0025E17338|nr:hypothetical protein [uncultured Intestinimonas sp.]